MSLVGNVGCVVYSVASDGLHDRDEPLAERREVGRASWVSHELDAEEDGSTKGVAVPAPE
eukprot:CAMPEP_0197487340 /NCGR_PEP_ID=MMETSP1311-20131121/2369_1 /TAXON_ID=464262 /ORGANISM="Genus nov. species nov., Strain RCC856" /LENGTH=59 /DNA_ID=CAMNT_0043030953 /DNA_START=230 /DNA_END=410 /DNA_ORIENTATION=-